MRQFLLPYYLEGLHWEEYIGYKRSCALNSMCNPWDVKNYKQKGKFQGGYLEDHVEKDTYKSNGSYLKTDLNFNNP